MNHERSKQPEENGLWQRYVQRANSDPRVADEIDPATLAAYLDGLADDAQTAKVEQAAAVDRQLLDQIIAIRHILELANNPTALPITPDRMRQRAIALVATRNQNARRWSIPSWSNALQWAAAAMVILAVGVAGYTAGGEAGRHEGRSESAIVATADPVGGLEEEQPMFLLAIAAGGGQ